MLRHSSGLRKGGAVLRRQQARDGVGLAAQLRQEGLGLLQAELTVHGRVGLALHQYVDGLPGLCAHGVCCAEAGEPGAVGCQLQTPRAGADLGF